jgi:hypothetical protein
MKHLFQAFKNGFYYLLNLRKIFLISMAVARKQHSNKLFIKYFRFNVVMAVVLGYYLFSLHALWFSEQYAFTMSLGVLSTMIVILIILNAVLAVSKKEKFTKNIKEDTKNIVGLNKFVSVMKTIAFNSMLTLMFYTLYVILFDLSVSHVKLLNNLIASCIVCTLGAFLMIYIDELVCIAIAIRLHKIGRNL